MSPNDHSGRVEEVQELSRQPWKANPGGYGPAKADWQYDSATMSEGHPHPACRVYRIEVARQAIWPAPSKRGRRFTTRTPSYAKPRFIFARLVGRSH